MAETLAYYKNGRLIEGSEDTPYPILVWGKTAGGAYVPLLVGADGTLQTAGGGGGGGDASAANQATQITAEQAILAQLDTKTSAVLSGLLGAGSKTLTDLATLLAAGVGVTNFPADQLVHAANLDVALSSLRGASTGTLEAIRLLLAATLAVADQAAAVSSLTLQNAVSATGNGTSLDVTGLDTVVFDVSGTFVGTVTFQGTTDDTLWYAINTTQLGSNVVGSTATAPGLFRATVTGLKSVRATVTWTSGTSVTVKARAVPHPEAIRTVQLASTNNLVDTELAAARLLADALSLPTAPDVIAAMVALNSAGTGLDVARLDHATNRALRSSLYAKSSAVGDTSLAVDGASGYLLVRQGSTVGGLCGSTANNTDPAASGVGSNVSAMMAGWDGAAVQRSRVANKFKTAQATASGNTALWTPTSGKKFRLMKLALLVTANASLAAGAVLTIDLQDAAASTGITFDLFVPTTAVTTNPGDAFEIVVDLGNGILSAAANNVLNVNLSAALATGNARLIVAGTEE